MPQIDGPEEAARKLERAAEALEANDTIASMEVWRLAERVRDGRLLADEARMRLAQIRETSTRGR